MFRWFAIGDADQWYEKFKIKLKYEINVILYYSSEFCITLLT